MKQTSNILWLTAAAWAAMAPWSGGAATAQNAPAVAMASLTSAIAAPALPPAPTVPGPDARFASVHGREGFWRTAKTENGTWWFLDPNGKAEFLNMVTTVQPQVRGRNLNGPDYVSRDWSGAEDGLDRWAQLTLKRISDMGFKGVGAWSNAVLHKYDVPMTHDLNVSAWTRWTGQRLFSAEWAAAAEEAVRSQLSSLRENRNLVGYYIDNELNWEDEEAGPGAYFDDLPREDANRQEVTRSIRATWPTLDLFNRDWKTRLADWTELDRWPSLPRQPAYAYNRLAEVWLPHQAETYFRITTDLIRKYDANHLILGARYRGGAPADVIRASRNYTDAQSINYYVNDARLDPDTFRSLSTQSDQPLIISEYSFHSLDGRSGDRNTVGFDAQVLDQKARADAYRLFTSRLARVPFVIGADWFQWMDEPPSGRQRDGEDCNFGIVDVDDRPYELMADAVRTTAPLLNHLHAESATDGESDVWRDSYASHPVTKVPQLKEPIHLDGELSDWPASAKIGGIRPAMAVGVERSNLPLPNVYLGWRPEGLYLAFEVFDTDVSAAPASRWWWARDCVEFWLATRPPRADQTSYDPDCHHFFFVPSESMDGTEGQVGQWHSPGDQLEQSLVPHPLIRQVTRILPDRYVCELLIPASSLHGFDPSREPVMAFNIDVRNYQHACEYFWSAPKAVLTQARPNTWGTLVLQGTNANAIANSGAEASVAEPVK